MNKTNNKKLELLRVPNLTQYQSDYKNRSKLLNWVKLIFSDNPRKIPIIFEEEDVPFYKKINSLTNIQKERLSVAAEFDDFESRGYLLYRITLTYKTREESHLTNKICDDHYINFYKRFLLPHLVGSKNFTRNTYRYLQPVCYAFQESGHEAVAHNLSGNHSKSEDNLHHHAVVAVLPLQERKMDAMCGINKIPVVDRFTGMIRTSEISRIDAGGSIYCTKQFRQHSDHLMFAPKSGLPEGDVRHLTSINPVERLFIF